MILSDVVVHYDGAFNPNVDVTSLLPSYLEANPTTGEYPYSRTRSGLFFRDIETCNVFLAISRTANTEAGWIAVTDSSDFTASSLPSFTSVATTHTEIANECIRPRLRFGCECPFNSSDTTCACCKDEFLCCSASSSNSLPIQNGRCQVCSSSDLGCNSIENAGGVENNDMFLLIIALVTIGCCAVSVALMCFLRYGCTFAKNESSPRHRRREKKNVGSRRNIMLDATDHGLEVGETVDVVSRRIWHKAEVLHIHSDNKSVTLRRLEDNKIAKKIPLSKIRRNGVRLDSRSARYRHMDSGNHNNNKKHEPFSLKTRGSL